MTATSTGRHAEDMAAKFLRKKGYKIVAQNWRTRWCEIDIVAQQGDTVYLCEVKYRAQNTQGAGLEYVTPTKLKQMHFAAEMWVAQHNWQGDYELCAIEVSGSDYAVTSFESGFL